MPKNSVIEAARFNNEKRHYDALVVGALPKILGHFLQKNILGYQFLHEHITNIKQALITTAELPTVPTQTLCQLFGFSPLFSKSLGLLLIDDSVVDFIRQQIPMGKPSVLC